MFFLHYDLSQIHHVHCQDAQNAETVPPKELANTTANKTINTLLRHLRIEFTHPVSAAMIRYIVTAVRTVLTDPTGQKNVFNVADFIGDIVKDPNTLITLQVLHTRLIQMAAAGRNSAIVLETGAAATRKILDEPRVLDATEGAIEGINCLLEDMTAQKLREGIARVIKLQKMASYFKPIKPADKIPAGLNKLKRSYSDTQVNYQSLEGEKEMQLQTRNLKGNGGDDDEHSWINKKPKGKKSGGKNDKSFEEESEMI